jgi:hypothetical protein
MAEGQRIERQPMVRRRPPIGIDLEREGQTNVVTDVPCSSDENVFSRVVGLARGDE